MQYLLFNKLVFHSQYNPVGISVVCAFTKPIAYKPMQNRMTPKSDSSL